MVIIEDRSPSFWKKGMYMPAKLVQRVYRYLLVSEWLGSCSYYRNSGVPFLIKHNFIKKSTPKNSLERTTLHWSYIMMLVLFFLSPHNTWHHLTLLWFICFWFLEIYCHFYSLKNMPAQNNTCFLFWNCVDYNVNLRNLRSLISNTDFIERRRRH